MNTIDAVTPRKKRKVSFLGIIAAFIILYTVLPIVPQLVSDYLTTYFYMLLVVFLFVVILLPHGLGGLLEHLLFLSPLILFEAITFFTRTDTVVLWGYGVLLSLLPMLLGYYIMKKAPGDTLFLRKVLLFALIVTAITSSIGLVRYPLAARTLASIESSDSPILRTYNYANIGGYNFVYTIVLLYPLLILAYKKKKIGRFVTILGVVLAFVLVVLSEYTTAFLLLLLSSAFFFFKRKLTVKRIIVFGFLGLLLVFLLTTLFARVFLWLANAVNSETMADRLRDLAGGWGGLERSEDPRLQFYLRSLSAFWQKPLLGHFLSGYSRVGGHSFLLDSLGLYGLFGAAILVFLYRKIYRTFFLPYAKEDSYGYVFWVFLQTLILSLINTGAWLWVLCCFAPILLSRIYAPAEQSAAKVSPPAAPDPVAPNPDLSPLDDADRQKEIHSNPSN